ncbi:Uncharacterised protein [Salmonella enterica subsp. enterica serovar Bovismorbificans]|uniref:Uncharacterized protein n=1 Tax=Salmonella enterica subsp. enterica serovar Bovismorbificans TaxID=58097 RepID=A0A655D641_SALET|nr:Uncharacterised protein [Salmonella enterica subsp. enterica serovar Bovismorbificans]CNU46186.1 Uncharacterised protein [Salmonella enterica subsp. enterica serovar Bovismorbificans]
MEGGQAVHKLHIRITGSVYHLLVDLIWRHQTDALRPGFFGFSHRDPDVGIEEIHTVNAIFNALR